MLTIWQRDTIIKIARELKNDPKNHPSETYRESFAGITQEQIDDTIQALRRIYLERDGRKGWEVIRAYRTRCTAAVVDLHLGGII